MLANPSRAIKYLSYLLKIYAFEVIGMIVLFLYGVNWRFYVNYIGLLIILDYLE